MLIGYMRVSKSDGSQTTDLQHDALIAAGVNPEHIYQDQTSGGIDSRPGLEAALKACRKEDVLVIWRLDRLGRSLAHLIATVRDLDERGIGIKVLTGVPIDTTSPAGKLVFAIFAALAEFEKEQLRERTRAGLAAARARGRKGGAPFKMTPAKVRLAAASMGKPGTIVGDLCKELGVTRQTLYRHVGPDGSLRGDGQKLLKAGVKGTASV
ncbi:recombinase family protein [Oryzomonas rubra]|uniref:Recombinase family protein n=1 Tax=Oryzomonas rubra TaxID=2509454 RepID=A0A5A9XT64_9BACT|nr:recombinase family protein [Oryzomonas rubra]KAA0895468.1 recombinase family protein [Oryzomonas rubra]